MKTDIVTKTRNTKWKFTVLIFLVAISILIFTLNKLEILGLKATGYALTICLLLFFFTAWFKNYKVNGHIEFGEYSIKVFENGKLSKKFDYETDKVKSVKIRWQAFSNDFVRIFSGFLYFDSWNDSLEIKTETDYYSFNIIMEQSKNERKPVDWVFNKLEEKGIKTGYERKIENLRPTNC